MRLHLLLAIKLSVMEKNIEDVTKTVVFFITENALFVQYDL